MRSNGAAVGDARSAPDRPRDARVRSRFRRRADARGRHRLHRIEGAAFHYDEAALGDAREIDEQVHAFGGRQQYLVATNAALEQAAVGADQDEGQRGGVVATKREPIRARIRRVEHAQPIAACRDVVDTGAARR